MESFWGEAIILTKIFGGARAKSPFQKIFRCKPVFVGCRPLGGGNSTNVYTGKVHPEVQPLIL